MYLELCCDGRQAGSVTVCAKRAGDSGCRVNVVAVWPLIFHRAGVKSPVRIWSCNRGDVIGARREKFVCERRMWIVVHRTRPNPFPFSFETSLANHPRPQKGGIALVGRGVRKRA